MRALTLAAIMLWGGPAFAQDAPREPKLMMDIKTIEERDGAMMSAYRPDLADGDRVVIDYDDDDVIKRCWIEPADGGNWRTCDWYQHMALTLSIHLRDQNDMGSGLIVVERGIGALDDPLPAPPVGAEQIEMIVTRVVPREDGATCENIVDPHEGDEHGTTLCIAGVNQRTEHPEEHVRWEMIYRRAEAIDDPTAEAIAGAKGVSDGDVELRELVKIVPLEDANFTGPVCADEGPRPPCGDVRRVFTSDDYPSRARMLNEQGVVRARLGIDEHGSVDKCEIVETSGSDTLDVATCRILQERVTMTPALDERGSAVAGTYFTPPIRWQLPGGNRLVEMLSQPRSQLVQIVERALDFVDITDEIIIVQYGHAGRIDACKRITYQEYDAATGCGGHFQRLHWLYTMIERQGVTDQPVRVVSRIVQASDFDETDLYDQQDEITMFQMVQTEDDLPFMMCAETGFFDEATTADECVDRLLSVRGPDASGDIPRHFLVTDVKRLPEGEDPGFTEAMRR